MHPAAANEEEEEIVQQNPACRGEVTKTSPSYALNILRQRRTSHQQETRQARISLSESGQSGPVTDGLS